MAQLKNTTQIITPHADDNIGISLSSIEKWADEDLAKSGLTRDDIEIRPYVDKMMMNQSTSGYEIPFRYPDGVAMRDQKDREFYRCRFCSPYPADKSGKRAKYGVLRGAGNHCFFPKGVDKLLADGEPLMLTEGEKKAAKGVKEGLPVIGVPGIWNWMASSQERRNASSDYMLHSDLVPYLEGGREVIFIYDSDARDSARKVSQFDMNLLRLAAELAKYGCSLYRVDIPQTKCSDAKAGLDDYLLTHSAEDFLRHVEMTKELVSADEARKLDDPYRHLTEKCGPSYEIRFTKEGQVSKIIFNQDWNAHFLQERYRLLFETGENRFYRYHDENGLWMEITREELQELLSKDLLEYWNIYHHGDFQALQLRKSIGLLKDSVTMLQGKIGKNDLFRHGGKPIVHVKNGMLDLESMTLKPFSPDYYSRNQIPLDFNENADCPKFINQLLAPALDDEAIAVFQKYAGQILLGMNASQQFMLLEGTAGGGKGTLVDVLKQVIGEQNVAELRTRHLDERFEFANYAGKTLLIGSDVKGTFLQQAGAEAIKKLTGGDPIDAEFKHANRHCLLRGNFCIVITSNNDLRVRLDGDNDAWRRRLILLAFVNPPPSKPIARFAETLFEEEGEGILNWMVHGAVAYMEDMKEFGRIHLPENLQDLADKLLYESDSIHNFVQEKVVRRTGETLIAGNVFEDYLNYCVKAEIPAVARPLFERGLAKEMKACFDSPCSHNCGDNGSQRGYRNFALA